MGRMILKNRTFERVEPSRDAKIIYIFPEGAKREPDYFKYFQEIDSRIKIVVYQLEPNQNNSPLGLFDIAKGKFENSKEYELNDDDEIWIVLDIEDEKDNSRPKQINQVIDIIKNKNNWYIARSNPCFEVWLYYHQYDNIPASEDINKCTNWKQLVNMKFSGGFDSRKHPLFIEKAIKNSENNFKILENNNIDIASTEIFKLANSIYPLVKIKLDRAIKENSNNL